MGSGNNTVRKSKLFGGTNNMTHNQQMKFWMENKNEITKSKDDFFVVKLFLENYKKNFESINEEILRK